MKSQIKIALFRRDGGNFGGVENQVILLTDYLIKKGFKVILFTDNNASQMSVKAEALGAEIYVVSVSNYIKCTEKIYNICIKENINIIQTHGFKENMIARMVKSKLSSLIHIYRLHTYIDCSQISNIKKNLYHILSKLTDSYVDMYVSINYYNVLELKSRSHIKENKIRVITDAIRSIGEPDNLLERKWPDNKISMIANLFEGKGHDTLILGLATLKKKGIIIQTQILGDISNEKLLANLKELAKKNDVSDQIQFCGFVNDIPSKLRDYSIVVLPSDSEGTPNSILEAMSLKKLVIVSDVGGVSEFINDGENGFLHKAKSPEDFAKAIEKVLNIDSDTMISISQKGYEEWQNFLIDVVGEKFISIYNELAG